MHTDNASRLHILLSIEQDIWVAQCLDFDITAQGKDIDNALDALERVLVGQIIVDQKKGNDPLGSFRPAPQKYWKLYEKGTKLDKEKYFSLPGKPKPTVVDNLRIAA